jgi:preprotein translocase subunit SecA
MSHYALAALADAYPQRRDWREVSWLDRLGERVRSAVSGRLRLTPWHMNRFVDAVERATEACDAMDDAARASELADVRLALRRDGPVDEIAARAFALIRVASGRILGMRHFPSQIRGAYVMLNGHLAEMDTGEGKTLTATLAAATMALCGRHVHVVTVNDYLAERDAAQMGPLFEAVGLTTGLVVERMSAEEKPSAYRADIVYCTSKILTFDYLRDRISLGNRMSPLKMSLDRLADGAGAATMLCGLQYAIVDEADSIFVDEARTPLIISRATRDTAMEAWYQQALSLARELEVDEHYTLSEHGRRVELSDAGCAFLEASAEALGGLWRGRMRREEVVRQALSAVHGFRRDIDYIVRDGKVMIVDENTGRVMPDRSWERGLQQLMEVKEGVEISPEKETLGRISFQLFFRRYQVLAGMSGTCREVAGEIGEVYGVPTVRVQPNRPSRRLRLPMLVLPDSAQRWCTVLDEIRRCRAQGQPVLVGTRSILASEALSGLLDAAGIEHQMLNAKQDGEEAEIVARAGTPGRVTIATNMAGRGTDIKLSPEAEQAGGLHVILTEGHDNARVDRQLMGRCARQGDPGSWQAIVSLEDELLRGFVPSLIGTLRKMLLQQPESRLWQAAACHIYRLAQSRVEAQHRKVRRDLLKSEFRTRQNLSFSGQME